MRLPIVLFSALLVTTTQADWFDDIDMDMKFELEKPHLLKKLKHLTLADLEKRGCTCAGFAKGEKQKCFDAAASYAGMSQDMEKYISHKYKPERNEYADKVYKQLCSKASKK